MLFSEIASRWCGPLDGGGGAVVHGWVEADRSWRAIAAAARKRCPPPRGAAAAVGSSTETARSVRGLACLCVRPEFDSPRVPGCQLGRAPLGESAARSPRNDRRRVHGIEAVVIDRRSSWRRATTPAPSDPRSPTTSSIVGLANVADRRSRSRLVASDRHRHRCRQRATGWASALTIPASGTGPISLARDACSCRSCGACGQAESAEALRTPWRSSTLRRPAQQRRPRRRRGGLWCETGIDHAQRLRSLARRPPRDPRHWEPELARYGRSPDLRSGRTKAWNASRAGKRCGSSASPTLDGRHPTARSTAAAHSTRLDDGTDLPAESSA